MSFGEPGYEERENIKNGMDVAASSGFTDVVLNTNCYPVIEHKSQVEALKQKSVLFATNLHLIAALTKNSNGEELAELYELHEAGVVGFYDYQLPIKNENLIKIALQYVSPFEGLVMSFPLNKNIAGEGLVHEGKTSTEYGIKGIPEMAETIQIKRDLEILRYTGGKLHIPLISSKKSVALIKEAKEEGLAVSCGVSAHHLLFDDSSITNFDANCKVSPVIRTVNDQEALIQGLKDGTIDLITSDHNPINIEHKKIEFQHALSGTIGLESLFVCLVEKIGLELLIDKLTTGPRNVFKLLEIKIEENQKACFTLFTLDESGTFKEDDILSTSKNSMFINEATKGKIRGIYNKGQLITT